MEQRHSKSVGAPPPIIDIVFDEPEHTPPSKQTKGKSAERPIVVDEHTTPPSKQTKGTSDERPMVLVEHTPLLKLTMGKSDERPIVVDEHTPPSKQTKGKSDERPMVVDEDYEGEGEGEGEEDLMDTDNYEPQDVLGISGKDDEYMNASIIRGSSKQTPYNSGDKARTYITTEEFNYTMGLLDAKINSVYRLCRYISDQQQQNTKSLKKLVAIDELSDDFWNVSY